MRSITKLDLQYAHRFYGFKGEAQYLHGHTGILTLEVEDTINTGVNMVFPCNEIQKTAWDVFLPAHFWQCLPQCVQTMPENLQGLSKLPATAMPLCRNPAARPWHLLHFSYISAQYNTYPAVLIHKVRKMRFHFL